jgi:hypothetical protein
MKVRALFSIMVTVPLISGCCCALPDLGALTGQGPLVGSGNVVTEEFDLSGFDRVEVSNAFDVQIRQGDDFSVTARVDDSVVEYLEIVQQGDTLRIGLKPHTYTMVNVETLEAEVTMPELRGLEVSGAGIVSLAGFQSSEAFYADVSGASSLHGDLRTGGVRFDVSGSSDAQLSGSGEDLVMNVSGASSVDLAEFPVGDADIQVSGASSAAVNVSGRLDVEASGGSHVRYRGDPTLGSVDSSGGSSIEAW